MYIEINDEGQYYSENCYLAYNGFKLKGYEIRKFLFSDLKAGMIRLEPGNIVYGNINSVRLALKYLGKAQPPCLDIPDILLPWCHRKIFHSTLGQIRYESAKWPVFLKPAEGHKLFTGYVMKDFLGVIQTAGFPEEMPVLCSEVVKFTSEYRAFIHLNDLLGIKHYKGNPFIAPCEATVMEMIKAYAEHAPAAYSLDVGILEDGRTALVEINDGFSLGAYGLPSLYYVKLIETRWNELCR